MRLENKVALISGGARGQGACEARMFAAEGAKVVFGDILDDLGQQVEAEIRELGCEATYVHLDVTSQTEWEAAVQRAVDQYGKLDVLVNNAGICNWGKLEDSSGEEWDRIMEVNGKGVFLGTLVAIPEMRRAGGGSIINISSISGAGRPGDGDGGLQCFQGGGSAPDQDHRHSIRRRRHSGKLGTPRVCSHSDDC